MGQRHHQHMTQRCTASTIRSIAREGRAKYSHRLRVGRGLDALGFGLCARQLRNERQNTRYLRYFGRQPQGRFLVVECTTGLLRAESKLSKLSAREAALRKMLSASDLQHVRVLPVIVTAMTRDEVKADLGAAAETGILVLTKEDLEAVLNDGRLRFENADQLFEQALEKLAESQHQEELPPSLF